MGGFLFWGAALSETAEIRKARPKDVGAVCDLIHVFAKEGLLLPRPYSEVLEHLRDFWVAEKKGQVVGAAALHLVGEDLAEIRSLAVAKSEQGQGLGRRLVAACLEDALALGFSRVFALTYRVELFERMGFRRVDKLTLPQKIWGVCFKCSKFSDCDETAVLWVKT